MVVHKLYPRDASCFAVEREGQRLHGFDVVVKERPGILNELSSVFRGMKINIVRGCHSVRVGDEMAFFIAFDITGRDDSIVGLLREKLLGIEGVVDVGDAEKSGNIVSTKRIFPVLYLGLRGAVFGYGNLSGITLHLQETIGDAAASLVLYSLGMKAGERVYMLYSREYDLKTMESLLGFLKVNMFSSGWGIIDEQRVTRNQIVITVKNHWECEVIGKPGQKRKSDYLRGLLTGYFSAALKKKIATEEIISCKKEGEHTKTTFIIKTQ